MEYILFTILFIMAISWLIIIKYLFNLLEKKHPEVYKKLGEPSLIWNNSMRNNSLFLSFLIKREYKNINDKKIINICNFLFVLIITYFITFFSLAVILTSISVINQ